MRESDAFAIDQETYETLTEPTAQHARGNPSLGKAINLASNRPLLGGLPQQEMRIRELQHCTSSGHIPLGHIWLRLHSPWSSP